MAVEAAAKLEAAVAAVAGTARRRHARWRQFLAGLLASLQTMSAGVVVGWDPVDGEDDSWLPSMATLGAVVGAAPAGWLADLLGRRTVLVASAVPGVLGWSLVVTAGQSASEMMLLYAGRFISGLSTGMTLVAVCMYNCEVSSNGPRGAVGSLQFLTFAAGLTWSRALAAFAPPLWLPSAAGISQTILALLLVFAPESPVFLASKGRTEDTEESLKRLGALDPTRDARVLEDLAKDRPAVGRLLRVGVIAVGLALFRQLVGARAVAALSRMVFPSYVSAKLPPVLALAISAVVGAVLPVVAGESVGRKALLLSSGAAMAVCHLALSVFLFVRGAHPGQDLAEVAWLPVAAALAHAAAFGAGFGPLPFVIVSEVAPPSVKGPIVSLAACADRILALVFTRAFYGSPVHVQHPVLSLVFCCTCCIGILFVVLYVPETSKKSLKEVQKLLK